MPNSFEINFKTLLAETVSEAHVRLRNQDPEYKQQSRRMYVIHEELETLLENKNAQPSAYHWDLVREYFKLDLDTYYPEHTATYIQALFDCVGVLVKMGWVKKI